MDEDDYTYSPRRYREVEKMTSDPRVYRITRNFRILGCDYCPPHHGHNRDGRVPCYDRYKSVRKGRCKGAVEPLVREVDGIPAKQNIRRRPSWWDSEWYLKYYRRCRSY